MALQPAQAADNPAAVDILAADSPADTRPTEELQKALALEVLQQAQAADIQVAPALALVALQQAQAADNPAAEDNLDKDSPAAAGNLAVADNLDKGSPAVEGNPEDSPAVVDNQDKDNPAAADSPVDSLAVVGNPEDSLAADNLAADC